MKKVEVSKEILMGINIVSISTFLENDGYYLLVFECGDNIQAATLLALLEDNEFNLVTGIDTKNIATLELNFFKADIKRRIRLVDHKVLALFDSSLVKYLTTGFEDKSKELATYDARIEIGGFPYSKMN